MAIRTLSEYEGVLFDKEEIIFVGPVRTGNVNTCVFTVAFTGGFEYAFAFGDSAKAYVEREFFIEKFVRVHKPGACDGLHGLM